MLKPGQVPLLKNIITVVFLCLCRGKERFLLFSYLFPLGAYDLPEREGDFGFLKANAPRSIANPMAPVQSGMRHIP
jgi:hypothetical protein